MGFRTEIHQEICSICSGYAYYRCLQPYIHKLYTEHSCVSLDRSVDGIFEHTDFRNYLVMLVGKSTAVNIVDVLLIVAYLTCLAIEVAADEQQWTYQSTKHAKPEKSAQCATNRNPVVSYCQPEDLRRGFITGGLFRYSRHPNFAAEQALWYVLYGFGCNATVMIFVLRSNYKKTWWNWTVIAPLSLSILIFWVRHPVM